jgi:hypothetical protein
MKNSTIERPSMLAAFCAPTSAILLPAHESVVAPVAGRAQLSQMRQTWTQAEQARTHATVGGSTRPNGLGSKGIDSAVAHVTDGASGVPPRGRPV